MFGFVEIITQRMVNEKFYPTENYKKKFTNKSAKAKSSKIKEMVCHQRERFWDDPFNGNYFVNSLQ